MPHAFVAGGCRVAPQHGVGTITCFDPSVCLANVPMLAPFMLQLEGALLPVLIALALVAFVAFTRRARSITTCPFKFGCGSDPSSRGMEAANGSTGVALTLVQLSQYDGRDAAKPLYLAVRGRIYDVSAGRSFYGPGAPVDSRHSVSVLLVCALTTDCPHEHGSTCRAPLLRICPQVDHTQYLQARSAHVLWHSCRCAHQDGTGLPLCASAHSVLLSVLSVPLPWHPSEIPMSFPRE